MLCCVVNLRAIGLLDKTIFLFFVVEHNTAMICGITRQYNTIV